MNCFYYRIIGTFENISGTQIEAEKTPSFSTHNGYTTLRMY